jgi:hypothetical protein
MNPVVLKPLNIGLVTMDSPVLPRPGSAMDSWNVEYTSGGSFKVRGGLVPLVKNPPGANQIAAFEGAETISGGAYNTASFFSNDVLGNVKTQSRAVIISNAVVSQSFSWAPIYVPSNLYRDRYICFWFYLDLLSGSKSSVGVNITFGMTGAGGAGFSTKLTGVQSCAWGQWVFVSVRMDSFTEYNSSGGAAPVWSAMTLCYFQTDYTASAVGSMRVSIDNLYVGPAAVKGLHQLRRQPQLGSDTFLFAYAETSIWVANLTANTWTKVIDGLTRATLSGPRGYFITYSDRAWFVNGVDRGVQVLDDTRWFYASPTPPADPLKVHAGGTGLVQLPGDYDWVFTWYNSVTNKESAPRVLQDTRLLTNQLEAQKYIVERVEDPLPNEGATHWIVYRLDPGSTIYRRTGDPMAGDPDIDSAGYSAIPISVKTITDNVENLSLGLELTTENHLMMPVLSAMVEMSANIVGIGAGKSAGTVYWNVDNFAEAWPTNSYQMLGAGNTDPLSGVVGYAGRVWVGRDSEWYEGIPIGRSDWLFQSRRTGTGPTSHGASLVGRGFVMYPGADGAYMLAGDGFPRKVSDLIQSVWDGLYRERLDDAQAAYDEEQSRWIVLLGDGASQEHNQVFVYYYHARTKDRHDRAVGAWERHRIHGTAMISYENDTGRNKTIISVPGGLVCLLFEGASDLGWPVSMLHETPWLDFGNQSTDKVLDGIDIDVGGTVSPSAPLTLSLFVDFQHGITSGLDYSMSTSGGFSPAPGVTPPFPMTFGPYGAFLRSRGPNIGKWRRIKLRIEHSKVDEIINFGSITFWIHGKSGRYKL